MRIVDSKNKKTMKQIFEELQALNQKIDGLRSDRKDLLTVKEAASFLGIAASTLYKWTADNLIPFYRVNGKIILFYREELLKWVLGRKVFSNAEIEEGGL